MKGQNRYLSRRPVHLLHAPPIALGNRPGRLASGSAEQGFRLRDQYSCIAKPGKRVEKKHGSDRDAVAQVAYIDPHHDATLESTKDRR